MSARTAEAQLRRFLLITSGFIFVGTVGELLLIGHMESISQWMPYVLSALGVGTVAAVFLAPQRTTLRGLWVVMAGVILGSLFGVFKHIEGNLAFEREVRPNAAIGEVWLDALGGVSPLLAPGILILAAVLALAATYRHPVLEKHPAGEQPTLS